MAGVAGSISDKYQGLIAARRAARSTLENTSSVAHSHDCWSSSALAVFFKFCFIFYLILTISTQKLGQQEGRFDKTLKSRTSLT